MFRLKLFFIFGEKVTKSGDAKVFLSSAEVAATTAILGKIPTLAEYKTQIKDIDAMAGEIYRYLNFHEIAAYKKAVAQKM